MNTIDHSVYRRNIELLNSLHPHVVKVLEAFEGAEDGKFELVKEPDGLLNYRWAGRDDYGYRRGDIRGSVERHLQTISHGEGGLTVFIGMGLGYGPLAVLRERPQVKKMVIVEPDVALFGLAIKVVDLSALLSDERVHLLVGPFDIETFKSLVEREAVIEDIHILRHVSSFQADPSSYEAIDDQIFALLNQLNAAGGTTSRCGPLLFHNRFSNLDLVDTALRLEPLEGLFAGVPAICIAAGPSLDKSLSLLKEMRNRAVFIAADSALVPLVTAGILPDFVTSIDFQVVNLEKFAPMLSREWELSLVSMIKGTDLVPKRFGAARHFLAFPEDRAHQWLIDLFEVKTLVPGAFSVAHLSLGLAIVMGADPIIMVGQDLAYTDSTVDHATGTVISGKGLPTDREILYERGIHGKLLPTDRQLLSLKKQFEDIIAEYRGRYINASADGLDIAGTTVIPLEEVGRSVLGSNIDVSSRLKEMSQEVRHYPRERLESYLQQSLEESIRLERSLQRSIDLTSQALKRLNKFIEKGNRCSDFNGLPREIAAPIMEADKLNQQLDSFSDAWEILIELTFSKLREYEDKKRDNQELKEREGYLFWLISELGRIRGVNQLRKKAVSEFKREVEELYSFLIKEKRLRGRWSEKRDLSAYKKLLMLNAERGRYRQLLYHFREVEELDLDAKLLAGEAYASILDFEKAKSCWQEVLQSGSDKQKKALVRSVERAMEPWILMLREYGTISSGHVSFRPLEGKWIDRIAFLAGFLEKLPGNLIRLWEDVKAWVKMKREDGDLENVIELLSVWGKLSDHIHETELYLADVCYEAGKLDEAEDYIRHYLKFVDDTEEGEILLGKILIAKGRLEEGVSLIDKAVSSKPDLGMVWEELGDALVENGDYEGAVYAYERCFLALPQRGEALAKMGECYERLGKLAAAMEAYRAALSRDASCERGRAGVKRIEGI